MIDGRTVLGVVPARGGSKGIARKNIVSVAGRPLLAWTAEAALGSRFIDRVVLSSDDPRIIEVARELGLEAPFVRPAELATDEASGTDVFLHALQSVPGYDYGVLLQPTSPLRTAADIDACIALCHERGADGAITVAEADKSPFWMLTQDQDGYLEPLLDREAFARRRQDQPRALCPNGAVYVVRTEGFLASRAIMAGRVLGSVMPRERSLDIDDAYDLKLFEALLALES